MNNTDVFLFSIAVLVYNEEKNIKNLLKKLVFLTKDYRSEILIIDSGSTDTTPIIINQLKIPHLRYVRIKKSAFNHGNTRNHAVKLAKGKYICFVSGDSIPTNRETFGRILQDFNYSDRVVCVFGKQIPRPHHSIFTQAELICRFNHLDQYINKNRISVQRKESRKKYKDNQFLLYFLSDVFSCYKRRFLVTHPFKKVKTSEDLLIGKEIIENGYIKIYDSRISVIHSHDDNLIHYFRKQRQEFHIKYNFLSPNIHSHFADKIKYLFSLKKSPLMKAYHLIIFIIYYIAKLLAYVSIRGSVR